MAAFVTCMQKPCPIFASHCHAAVQANALLEEFSSVLTYILGGVSSDLSAFGGLDYTSNFSCPTDGTAGGIKGPSIGQLTATASLDPTFYSYAGCNCSQLSANRNYNISSAGKTCIFHPFFSQRYRYLECM